MDLGKFCSCGSTQSLYHLWTGCLSHQVAPLLGTLSTYLDLINPVSCILPSVEVTEWGHPWFPLLILKELESKEVVGKKTAKKLKASRGNREWAIGSYLWLLWTNKMNEVHGGFPIQPSDLRNTLSDIMTTPPDLRSLC